MPKKPTNAESWMRERVQGEVERMLEDFCDRGLFMANDKERAEMTEEIADLIFKKRWKRA